MDAVVFGRLGELCGLLADHPNLVTRRSAYGHWATLLHYTVAKRSRDPPSSRSAQRGHVATMLLAAGADVAAKLEAYGGSFDTLAMLRSSGHPPAAGVAAQLERVLTS